MLYKIQCFRVKTGLQNTILRSYNIFRNQLRIMFWLSCKLTCWTSFNTIPYFFYLRPIKMIIGFCSYCLTVFWRGVGTPTWIQALPEGTSPLDPHPRQYSHLLLLREQCGRKDFLQSRILPLCHNQILVRNRRGMKRKTRNKLLLLLTTVSLRFHILSSS